MEPPVIVFLLLFVWALSTLNKEKKGRKFEFVKTQLGPINPVAAAIAKGYNAITRISKQPFFVQYWQKDYLVLPAKYLQDVRRAPKEHLTFVDSISDLFFMYNWIGDLFKSNRMVFAVMKGINPKLPKLSELMFEESKYAFDREFGDCTQPKKLVTLDVMTKISLRVMTRIIVGTELSRNDKFLRAANTYFGGNFLTGMIMLKLPFGSKIRDIIAWPLWKYHQIFNQEYILNIIKPVVAKRMDDFEQGAIEKERFDAVTCTLKLLDEYPFDMNSEYTPLHTLSHETLQLVWAAGQSPAMSITTVIFKLLEEQQYIEPLRNEARAAVEQHGWRDPIFNQLPMMDSFIRETHRLHPAFSLNATRYVKDQPFTFSDGLTVPVGTRIAFAAEAMQRDPDIMSDPDTFDGFRFVKLAANDGRQEDGVNRWAASHCSFSNLTFGYGNHACPGRFIAIRLLKIMLCRLLLEYDMDWDFKGGEPPRFVIEGASVPNVSQKIIVKTKEEA